MFCDIVVGGATARTLKSQQAHPATLLERGELVVSLQHPNAGGDN